LHPGPLGPRSKLFQHVLRLLSCNAIYIGRDIFVSWLRKGCHNFHFALMLLSNRQREIKSSLTIFRPVNANYDVTCVPTIMHVFHVTMIARFHSTYYKTTHKIDQSHECGLCLSIVNAVVIAVAVMLLLALLRVHVVIALFLGRLAGGLMAGMGIEATMLAFQSGLGDSAKIALSYALLGAFAMAVAASGLPKVLADTLIRRLDADA